MAAGPFEADLAMPFGVAARGGGPTLIRRLHLYANQSGILPPAGAAWMIASGLGCGGAGATNNSGVSFGAGGASAALSRVALNPGSLTLAAVVSQSAGTNTSLTVGGIEVLRAASATAPTGSGNTGPSTPGLASGCIGDVKISGSLGALGAASPGAGANAPQEPGATPLLPAGLGAIPAGIAGSRGTTFGSGGAGGGNPSNGDPTFGFGGPGLIILEFWSGKP